MIPTNEYYLLARSVCTPVFWISTGPSPALLYYQQYTIIIVTIVVLVTLYSFTRYPARNREIWVCHSQNLAQAW